MIPVTCNCGKMWQPLEAMPSEFGDSSYAAMRQHWEAGHTVKLKTTNLVEFVVFQSELGEQLQRWQERGCPGYGS